MVPDISSATSYQAMYIPFVAFGKETTVAWLWL